MSDTAQFNRTTFQLTIHHNNILQLVPCQPYTQVRNTIEITSYTNLQNHNFLITITRFFSVILIDANT